MRIVSPCDRTSETTDRSKIYATESGTPSGMIRPGQLLPVEQLTVICSVRSEGSWAVEVVLSNPQRVVRARQDSKSMIGPRGNATSHFRRACLNA